MIKIRCNECKKELSEKAKICPNCGYRIKRNKICYNCFHRNVQDATICTKCKVPLDKNTVNTNLLLFFVGCIVIISVLNFIYSNKEISNSVYDDNDTSSEKDDINNNSSGNRYEEPTNSEAKFMAERICKNYLKSPSSAKWGKSINLTSLGNDKYSVSGTVEAQNSYGAMVSATYFAYFTFTGSGYKDEYCSIINN